MKLNHRRFFLLASITLLAVSWTVAAEALKPRLKRSDSFFGLHFDLHPNKTDKALGRDLTEAMVERLLTRVRPDYVQYDCKGHAGYLGYPSKVGTSSPGIVQDSLEIWRRVTARHGVALFIHFSGVWDSLAIQQHPEWAAVRADGTLDPRVTSTSGPYVDELMIPQLKEVAEKYDLDGAWIDGECWSVRPDYSAAAARAFRQSTGIQELPKGPNQRGWLEFLEFNREQFRKYVKHYVDVLHSFRPNFQLASNWLYTTYVPERPELPVDFLSGDYLGNASISTARLEARYLSAVGKPWDLMAWGFQRSTNPKLGHNHKPAVQLLQEAGVVLAQGGGFQVYYQPTRAGWIDDRHIEVMAPLAKFCRARQALSHRSETVPQIGLVFSKTSLYSSANKLFGGWGAGADPARGLLDALIENHYPVDVIPEWCLKEDVQRYPLIVVPDWPNLGLAVKDTLVQQLKRGGSLLIAGAENADLFSTELGVGFVGAPLEQDALVLGEDVFGNVRGLWQEIRPEKARAIETRFPSYDSTKDGVCAATVNDQGKGKIAAIYGPIGSVFAATHAPATRRFIRRVVDQVFSPMVHVDAPPTVEVVLRQKGPKLILHLLNATAMQVASDYAVSDFVPVVGPIGVTLQLKQEPRRVLLQPEGVELSGKWKDKTWSGTIDKLQVHSLIVFEM